MGSVRFLDYSWLACGVMLGAWAILLIRRRLAHRFPLVTVFFAVGALQMAVGFLMSRMLGTGMASRTYAWFWVVSGTITWTLYFCVLIEIFKEMLAGYEGFRRLGQLFLSAALASSTLFVLSLVWIAPADPTSSWMTLWVLEERSIYTALTVLALLLVGFGVYFRLRVPGDVLVLLGVFGFMFGGQAGLWALRGFFGAGFRPVRNIASPLLVMACLGLGAVLLSKAQDQPRADPLASANAQTASLAAARLRSLNETLQRLLRW